MTLRLFVLSPTVLFRAWVNMPAGATYPVDTITFDNTSVGSYSGLRAGMTLLLGSYEGGEDLGRVRLRKDATATEIYVGRASRGRSDGELDVADNAFITVLWDYRVWSKTPNFDDGVNLYMDSDLTVGTNTSTGNPPVANTGPPAIGTITAGKLRVQLPASGTNTSFAVADGATIISYSWGLPAGVTLVGGYAASSAVIQVDCDPGFFWVALTVVDSNGKAHTARTWIYARDPAADQTVETFTIDSHRITAEGQQLSVRLGSDLLGGATLVGGGPGYPDGTLVAIMDGEMSGPTDRSNLLFWGWHQTDPTEIRAERTGILADTILECVDVAGRLNRLPGFSTSLQNDVYRDTDKLGVITWYYMTTPNCDKYTHYILQWFSTALDVTDWVWSATGNTFAFVLLESDAQSLWRQLDGIATRMGGYYALTCDRKGKITVTPEPLHRSPAFRTGVTQVNIFTADWTAIDYTGQRPPTVHWLRGAAVVARATYFDPPTANFETVFALAPGLAPGQGETEQNLTELLVPSQAALNVVAGQRYARANAPRGLFRITLAGSSDRGIEPAALTWVYVQIDTYTTAQRKFLPSTGRGLARELNIAYQTNRSGTTRTVEMTWEEETIGASAQTVSQ